VLVGVARCAPEPLAELSGDPVRPARAQRGGATYGVQTANRLVPEAPVLREWGGQTVAVPYLEGRSTTRLVESVVARTSPTARSDEKEGVA